MPKRLLIALTPVVAALALALGTTAASAAPAAQGHMAAVNTMAIHAAYEGFNTPPPPCAAGYFALQDNHLGDFVTGAGVNAPVYLGSGNCFELIYEGDGHYSFQNADGHCIWNNLAQIELGKACAGRTNELAEAVTQHGDYWSVHSESSTPGAEGFWDITAYGCGAGDAIFTHSGEVNSTCDYFNFFG